MLEYIIRVIGPFWGCRGGGGFHRLWCSAYKKLSCVYVHTYVYSVVECTYKNEHVNCDECFFLFSFCQPTITSSLLRSGCSMQQHFPSRWHTYDDYSLVATCVLLLSQSIAPPTIRPQKTIAQQTTNDYFVLFLLLRQQLAIFNRGDDFVAPRLLLLHFVIMQGTKYICYPFEWLNC
jgi:hypothetical protein